MMSDQSTTMAVAEQPTSPAFTRMPNELLNMILEQVVTAEWYWHIYPTLKNLRVACRQYAYLAMLLDMLFATVRLVASAEHAETVAKTDLSTLKHYVKSVSFEPTKESWMTKRELFDDIILVRPFEEAVHTFYDAWRIEGGYRSFQEASTQREEELKDLGIRGFIEKHLPNGHELFSEEEMRAGYEAYMSRANAAKAVSESGELASTWTKALSQLDRVERVSVGLWEWDRDSLDQHVGTQGKSWKELGPVVYGHNHPRHNGYPHEPTHCREVQVPVGKALFDAVLETLATSKTKLKQLTIDSCDTGEFAWADDARVADLDFTNLTHFTFRPCAEEIGEASSWEADRTASIEARSGKAITALLQRCAASLTDLELFTGVSFCPNIWPPQDVDVKDLPDLPSLTNFVTATTLNLNSFPAWLKTKCRALARLELQMCHGHPYGESGWRSLWDAIRYHPNRMLLDFDQLPCNDAAEISLRHYTGEASAAEVDEDPWMDIDRSLENYLSNKGDWNGSLREWFGGDDEDDEDDEEEEEGSDGGDDDEEGEDGDEDGDEDEEMGSDGNDNDDDEEGN